MFATHRQRRRAVATAACALLGAVVVSSIGSERADAFKYPDEAEAKLLLDGTQTAPHDGFNMQIDTNGFGADGGDVIDTHMFCINATLPYRCALPNNLVRVQADPSTAGLSADEANRLAWILTNRSGYGDEEVQHALWCVTDPGAEPHVGNSEQLCNDSVAFAVPAAPVLSLTNLGADTTVENRALHFSLTTNAKTVTLDVSDGGDGPTLCGDAPDNASADLTAGVLMQHDPVATRTFELCLTRAGVPDAGLDLTLEAALEATSTNLQVWVHPEGPTTCQGVIDTQVSSQRLTASADGRYTPATGSLTIRKTTVGDFPEGTVFTVHVEGMDLSLDHDFPDADGDPYEHTFTDLPAGTYTVTETATGGATTVEISNGGVAVVERSEDTVIDVVNSATGNLVLEKITDVDSDDEFVFTVECTYLDEPVGDWSNPVSLDAGGSFDSGQLPAGSSCTVTETDTGGAIATVFRIEVGDVSSEDVGVSAPGIEIPANDTVEVTFTNVFTEGSTTSAATTTTRPDGTAPGNSTTTTDEPNVTVGTTAPGPGGGLPVTGSTVALPLWIAALMAVGGAGLALATRERRRVVSRT